jgi:hypothetical protein
MNVNYIVELFLKHTKLTNNIIFSLLSSFSSQPLPRVRISAYILTPIVRINSQMLVCERGVDPTIHEML